VEGEKGRICFRGHPETTTYITGVETRFTTLRLRMHQGKILISRTVSQGDPESRHDQENITYVIGLCIISNFCCRISGNYLAVFRI